MNGPFLDIGAIILASAAIFSVGKTFAIASSRIGDYFRLPRSVKGATFDAISSSFPELMIALFAVIVFKEFDVGIGTITGSALFNLLVIPGVSVLVAPVAFKVSSVVIKRDGGFYIIAVLALFAALLISKTWAILVPVIFLTIYAGYLYFLVLHTKRHRKLHPEKHRTAEEKKLVAKEIIIGNEIFKAVLAMVVIAIAAFFLTRHSIHFAEVLGIPSLVIGFTIAAAATSIPDMVISVVNAKRGQIDDSASNVFGSNVFDILVGLSLPVLIATFLFGPVEIFFEHMEIVIGLLVSTFVVIGFMYSSHKLSKIQAWILLALYIVFVSYVVMLSV